MANKKVKELRGLIYEKYASESEMARQIGWERQRLNKITNGVKEPDIYEAVTLARALGTTVDAIADIFSRIKSPNGQYGA